MKKIRKHISNLKKRGLKIKPPSINKSGIDFKVDEEGVLFGLSAISGIGKEICSKIIKNRPKTGYKSFGNFVIKNLKILNKTLLEQLAKAGAFNDLGINKESAIVASKNILEFVSLHKSIENFYTIFDLCNIKIEEYIDNVEIKTIDIPDNLEYELETLGHYITKHPMDGYILDTVKTQTLEKIKEEKIYNKPVTIVGSVCRVKTKNTKAKKEMAVFELITNTDSIECIVFPAKYAKLMDVIQEGKLLTITGTIKEDEHENISNDEENDINQNIQLMVDNVTDNAAIYLSKEEEEKPEYNVDKWLTNINTNKKYSESKLGIIINKQLSYILTK